MHRTILAAGLLAALPGVARAATIPIQRDGLEAAFDDATGALAHIRYRGDTIAAPPAGRSPLSFGVGPQDRIRWFENIAERGTGTVVKREQTGPDAIAFTIRAGDFDLVVRYALHAGPARLDRSLTLTNRGTEPVKLRNVNFKTFGVVAPAGGFYRFLRQWPPGGHAFAEMKPGRQRGGGGPLAVLAAQLSPSRSVMWMTCATDPAGVRVTEGDGRFDVVQDLHACGYLQPNRPQEFGPVSLQIVDAGYWEALPALWAWMDRVGLNVPADRPRWVEEAILYGFHPGGTIGSDFKDLGGFRNAAERLLPAISRLGATAVWILPVEQKSPYWPYDYYRFMDGLGTPEEYRALVARAHDLGLKVWQDLVPHGGSPQAVHNRAHPEFMLRREDGSTLAYWLNDFAWPAWQKYMADVATHYCRVYGVDGFRVDACGGSREPNWNPDIPYARASHALLWGGLGMLRGLREAVRAVDPEDGAILAEAENARLLAAADAQYDFGFCYAVCPAWRRMPAPAFADALREYLEEQKFAEPRGAVRLRHVESHDSLRAELWYGADGLRALYALSAWIDGIPLIYHGMETGHELALARIHAIRRDRPELSRGETFYRAVACDAPGVFACLRRLGDRESAVVINFNREAVKARLTGLRAPVELALPPLAYTVVPAPPPPPAEQPGTAAPPPDPPADGRLAFPGATEWFADTISGRLHGLYAPRPDAPKAGSHGIYWRPAGTGVLWQNELQPLHPARPRVGVRGPGGGWTIATFDGPVAGNPRFVAGDDRAPALRLEGLDGPPPRLSAAPVAPPAPDPGMPFAEGRVALRCIGPDLVVSTPHVTAVLRRQGGVIRELVADGKPLATDQDLYGDQEAMRPPDGDRIDASDDVECSLRIGKAEGGLRLAFEGRLRGFHRFALKRPALFFRNELVFGHGPRFVQTYAFRAEKGFRGQPAFLASILHLPAADRFRFLRGGAVTAEGPVGPGNGRIGETRGGPAPDRIEFTAAGARPWGLAALRVPDGSDCNLFLHGRQFFIALLDSRTASLDDGRWYEFRLEWDTGSAR